MPKEAYNAHGIYLNTQRRCDTREYDGHIKAARSSDHMRVASP